MASTTPIQCLFNTNVALRVSSQWRRIFAQQPTQYDDNDGAGAALNDDNDSIHESDFLLQHSNNRAKQHHPTHQTTGEPSPWRFESDEEAGHYVVPSVSNSNVTTGDALMREQPRPVLSECLHHQTCAVVSKVTDCFRNGNGRLARSWMCLQRYPPPHYRSKYYRVVMVSVVTIVCALAFVEIQYVRTIMAGRDNDERIDRGGFVRLHHRDKRFGTGMLTRDQVQTAIYRLMFEIQTLLARYNVDYFLAAGSLLGAIRSQGAIPHDDDIDIVIFDKDLARIQNMLIEEPQGYHLDILNSKFNENSGFRDIIIPMRLICKRTGLYVDVFQMTIKDDVVEAPRASIAFHSCKGCKGKAPKFPLDWVVPLRPCLFNFVMTSCMAQSEQYLEWWFGDDWRIEH